MPQKTFILYRASLLDFFRSQMNLLDAEKSWDQYTDRYMHSLLLDSFLLFDPEWMTVSRQK